MKIFRFNHQKHLTFSRLSESEDKSEGHETAEVLKLDAGEFINDLWSKGAEQETVDQLKRELSSTVTYSDLLALLAKARNIEFPGSLTADLVHQLNTISRRIQYPASKRWYCLCFSAKETEDYLLWSAYTRERLGVCVEFCQKRLVDQLSIYGYSPGAQKFTERFSELFLDDVSYRADLAGNTSEDEEDYVFTKSDHFSGEKEFRIAGKTTQFGLPSSTVHMKLEDVPAAIKSVSISPFYSSWEAQAVKTSIQAVWSLEHGVPLNILGSAVTRPIE